MSARWKHQKIVLSFTTLKPPSQFLTDSLTRTIVIDHRWLLRPQLLTNPNYNRSTHKPEHKTDRVIRPRVPRGSYRFGVVLSDSKLFSFLLHPVTTRSNRNNHGLLLTVACY